MGCFLEVNIDYFDELYDLHNVYPVATKKMKVTKEILSKVQTIEDNTFLLGKNEKFISNIGNKRKNILHYQGLKT